MVGKEIAHLHEHTACEERDAAVKEISPCLTPKAYCMLKGAVPKNIVKTILCSLVRRDLFPMLVMPRICVKLV